MVFITRHRSSATLNEYYHSAVITHANKHLESWTQGLSPLESLSMITCAGDEVRATGTSWTFVNVNELRPSPLQVKHLGKGSFGVTKLMRYLPTKELVAVKFIPRGRKVCAMLLPALAIESNPRPSTLDPRPLTLDPRFVL